MQYNSMSTWAERECKALSALGPLYNIHKNLREKATEVGL